MTALENHKPKDSLLIALTCALLALVLVQIMIGNSSDLYWDADPRASTSQGTPILFGPTSLAWIGVISSALAGLVLWAHGHAGGRLDLKACLLAGVGVAACVWHMGDHIEDMRRLGSWIGVIVTALAAHHLAMHKLPRRYIVAGLIAILLPLTIDSLMYRFYEIPMTIEHFRANEAEFLRSRGWLPGSSQHELYIRRLQSPDVIGPIGMSNVFGSMVAAMSILAGCVTLRRLRSPNMQYALAPGIAVVGGVVVVAMTYSKGAAAALVLVSAVLAGAGIFKKLRRLLPLAAVGLVVLVFAGVLVRGAAGPPDTAAGERSILFRYHYWQGAVKAMAVADPQSQWLGLGVQGFLRSYLIHKNPLNPEEVASAHNVFVDYVTMLGIGGLALSALLVMWLWRAGRFAIAADDDEDDPDEKPMPMADREVYAAVAIAALVFGVQFIYQYPVLLSPESFLTWAFGAMGFIVIFALLASPGWISRSTATLGLFGAAAVVLVHGQIEMTFFQEGAATFFMTIIAVAAAPLQVNKVDSRGPATFTAALLILLTIGLVVGHALPMTQHQQAMAQAAAQLRKQRTNDAANTLDRAHQLLPINPEPIEQRARLFLETAAIESRQGQIGHVRQSISQAMAALNAWPGEETHLLRLKFQTQMYAAVWLNEPDRLNDAAAFLLRVTQLAPHSLQDHLRLADLYWKLNRIEDAKEMYRYCMKLHRNAYLDSARQLNDKDLKRVVERAK